MRKMVRGMVRGRGRGRGRGERGGGEREGAERGYWHTNSTFEDILAYALQPRLAEVVRRFQYVNHVLLRHHGRVTGVDEPENRHELVLPDFRNGDLLLCGLLHASGEDGAEVLRAEGEDEAVAKDTRTCCASLVYDISS